MEGIVLVKVVEELLSKSGAMGLEAAKAIADAAMLEVASTNVPNMVTMATYQHNGGVKKQNKIILWHPLPDCNGTLSTLPQAPDEFYEGITFEHFEQV